MRASSHADYTRWNAELIDYACEYGVDPDGRFFLVVRQMLEDAESSGQLTAEQSFLQAVRQEYAELLLSTDDPLGTLRGMRDPKGRPLCVGMLGAFVLAAEDMVDNGYYDHLGRLLAQHRTPSAVTGFVGETFESCWDALDQFLLPCGYYLAKPEGGKRYVKWPRMHALLRACDVEKLPTFFMWAGTSPTSSVAEGRMKTRFDYWLSSQHCNFTQSGKKASQHDVRGPAILRQVMRVFSGWDGTPRTSTQRGGAPGGKRSVPTGVRIFADVPAPPAEPTLWLRAEKKAGCPPGFTIGGVHITATRDDDPFYPDVLLPPFWKDHILINGTSSVSDNKKFVFRGAEAFALCWMDDTGGYESRDALIAGVTAAAVCTAGIAPSLERHLCHLSGKASPPKRITLGGCLPGWYLYHGFVPNVILPAPMGLDNFGVEDRLTIRPVGGLRLGRQREWMHGMPPVSIDVLGVSPPPTVSVNGKDVDTRAETAHLFGNAQTYELRAGRFDYRLSVVEPRLSLTLLDAMSQIFSAPAASIEDASAFGGNQEACLGELRKGGRAYFIGSVPGFIASAESSVRPGWARWLVVLSDEAAVVVRLCASPGDEHGGTSPMPGAAIQAWGDIARAVLSRIFWGGCRIGILAGELEAGGTAGNNQEAFTRRWARMAHSAAEARCPSRKDSR